MRTEVTVGQYLDVLTQATGDTSVERAGKVARYKSAKYTVERPLLLGAALAGAPAALSARLLGVRAAARRGVPAARRRARRLRRPGADRQAGRRRPARGQAHLPGGGGAGARRRRPTAALLHAGLGDPDLDAAGVARLREIITDTGALARTEQRITTLTDAALDRAGRRRPGRRGRPALLADLAIAATRRAD